MRGSFDFPTLLASPEHQGRRRWTRLNSLNAVAIASTVLAPTVLAYDYYSPPTPKLYETSISLPGCDYVIDSVAKWANINSGSYRVFCVAPGDYTSAGIIKLTASGTENAPRWIRYYNPSVSDSTHPYHMSAAQRAIINGLLLDGGKYWILDRLTMNGKGASNLVLVTNGSGHNVFNRIDGYDFGIGINLYYGASYNTVQNSTLHDMARGIDAAAIQSMGWDYAKTGPKPQPQFNRIIGNEIWNVGDGFQTLGESDSNPDEDYRGTIVYNNDIYQTSARYTNCKGTFTPTGNCACSENAIDLKSGSGSADHPIILAHNRFWGFRPADRIACPQHSDPGAAIGQHFGTDNIKIQGNVIWDSAIGYMLGDAVNNIELSGNLIHSVYQRSDGTTTTALYVAPSGVVSNLAIKRNVVTQNTPYPRQTAYVNGAAAGSKTFAFSENVLIDSKQFIHTSSGFNGVAAKNRYYNADKPSWDQSPLVFAPSSAQSGYGEFCFDVKRLTAPTRLCLQRAVAAPQGPIAAPTGLSVD